ncbi:MAG: spore germination protein [Dehalobacter sp.]|nr:spore germination protein [Dehalobacter sp.]
MFNYILKKLLFLLHSQNCYPDEEENIQRPSQANLSDNLKNNLDILRGILGTSPDITIREFAFGFQGQTDGALIFLNGMTDLNNINDNIIKPLMYDSRLAGKDSLVSDSIEVVRKTMLSVGYAKKVTSIDEIVEECLSGNTVLLINGSSGALVMSGGDGENRGVEEPQTDSVVRGPREGFNERILTNITLLRRKIKNPNFTVKTIKIGKQTKTTVCIVYLKGIANPKLIAEVQRRISRIKTDAILESGYIEQYIEDAPFSIFATVANSEKPDIIAAKILEGRAAIMVDGTPFVLTVPMVFIESFQSSEDYYARPYFVSVIRVIRFIAYTISILAPATYVAISTFHQELLPTPLLITMAAAEEGVPFPAIMEAFIMGIIFEILREAGIRLPRPVGQAISIVGALVIGESAVSAGLIGSPMVIVVALTAVASFAVPGQTDSGGILRLIFVILAGTSGGYGIMIGLLGMLVHFASLRSFGIPYLSPLAPLSLTDMKDTFIRAPIWAMVTRPRAIGWHDPERQDFRLRPEPPSKETNKPK